MCCDDTDEPSLDPPSSPQRVEIVAKAREYLGTPFQHQGRLKGRGVDCTGVIICVARDLGIADWTVIPEFSDYPETVVDDRVLKGAQKVMDEIPEEQMQPGDVLILRVLSVPSHAAIVTEIGGMAYIVHAYSGSSERMNRVVENILDQKWRRRIAGVFCFPGLRQGTPFEAQGNPFETQGKEVSR